MLVLAFDQYLKVWVKTHMRLEQQIPVLGNWFSLHFIENEGMAFGWKFWGDTGKIILTCFRIVAATGIAIYILRLIKKGLPKLSLIFFSLILAGAMGNIIDSIFYGQIFTQSNVGSIAEFADGNGYATYFRGWVVDMLYFPLIETTWPDWVPYLGGKSFEFFRPIFNIADASITIGVIGMLLFQRRVFAREMLDDSSEIEIESEVQTEQSERPDEVPTEQSERQDEKSDDQ